LLRLVPLYWVIGLLTVAAEFWLAPHGQQFHKLSRHRGHLLADRLGNSRKHHLEHASLCIDCGWNPFLFKLTKDNRLDANIGELSYPIYMCHLFVMGLVQWSPLKNASLARHILTIILVIIVAFLLDRLLILPIHRLRLKFGASIRDL